MGRKSSRSHSPSPGTVTVKCMGRTDLHRSGYSRVMSVRLDEYEYQAPADVACGLAQFDKYTTNVYTASDNCRRFVPHELEGIDIYIARAFQIGLGLLVRDRHFDKATHDDYCLGKLAFDWLRRIRERMKPRGLTTEELIVPAHMRRDLLWPDALPDELGNGEESERGSALVNRIIAAGAAAVCAREIPDAEQSDVIGLGLMDQAACMPPLAADPDQIAGLIRGALFDLSDDEDEVPTEVWEEVGDQFEQAIRDRLLISMEDFNRWLTGRRAYMLQTVEKGTKLPATTDRRNLVRRAMLEEAWRGFGQVSECLEAFARAFERSLARPLSDKERRLYAVMYRRQPYFGNLVLPLLLDVKDLLKYAILDIWETPDGAGKIEVFQRMLHFRSQIIPRVREIQRTKRTSQPRTTDQSVDESSCVSRESTWDDITGHLLEQRRIVCPRCNGTPSCSVIRVDQRTKSVRLDVHCPTHGEIGKITVAQDDLKVAGELLLGNAR